MKIAIFLLSSVTSSQIWLTPLVDDYQTTYVTKLMKKEKKRKEKKKPKELLQTSHED
jgi:hypothetical protein